MSQSQQEESIARLLRHQVEQSVPDEVNLWPAIQKRLAERAAASAGVRRPEAKGYLCSDVRTKSGELAGIPERQCSRLRMVAAAATLMVAIAGGLVWSAGLHPVSAAEIVGKAQTALLSPELAGIKSFALTESTVWSTPQGESRNQIQRWYQAPDRYRFESRHTNSKGISGKSVMVSDGTAYWNYSEQQRQAFVSDPMKPPMTLGLTWSGEAASSLEELLEQFKGNCYNPVLTGTERVAGREAWVIDLGAYKCTSNALGEARDYRNRLWVDKGTFFVLKNEHARPDGTLIERREVTAIQFDVNLELSLFTFEPPAGVMLYDNRSKPAPGAEQYQQQLAELAAKADFPLFYPQAVPAGLAPAAPRLTPAAYELSYVPAAKAAENVPEPATGIHIMMRKATRGDAARPLSRMEPVVIGPLIGWYLPGVKNPDGTGSTALVRLVRDGTLVSLSSFDLGKSELVQMAESLTPVPGGHGPLPNPVAWTLNDLRQALPYPLLLPVAPDGLKPGAPHVGIGSESLVHIDYSDTFGKVQLGVTNGLAGCCLDSDGRKNGESVPLAGGVTGHFLDNQPEFDGPILWWQQEGAYVALSGPDLQRADLIRIAATVSPSSKE